MHIDVIYHVVYTTTLWMLRGAHETLAASACVRNRVCLSVLMYTYVCIYICIYICIHICTCFARIRMRACAQCV